MIMEQFWNYFGFVGIAIMMLTLVVIICEYVDRAIANPSLSDDVFDFWIPARFQYKHRWVQIIARLCMAVSVILILIISAGPLYDELHQSLKAPFAYSYVLFECAVAVYLWMQIVRILGFLLLMLAYVLFWCYCWVLGFDTNRI